MEVFFSRMTFQKTEERRRYRLWWDRKSKLWVVSLQQGVAACRIRLINVAEVWMQQWLRVLQWKCTSGGWTRLPKPARVIAGNFQNSSSGKTILNSTPHLIISRLLVTFHFDICSFFFKAEVSFCKPLDPRKTEKSTSCILTTERKQVHGFTVV